MWPAVRVRLIERSSDDGRAFDQVRPFFEHIDSLTPPMNPVEPHLRASKQGYLRPEWSFHRSHSRLVEDTPIMQELHPVPNQTVECDTQVVFIQFFQLNPLVVFTVV